MKRILSLSVLSLSLFVTGSVLADCPQLYAQCVVLANGICNSQGTTYVDSCWSWSAAECEPCANADNECNAAFSGCNGNCMALSTDQSAAMCNNTMVRAPDVIEAYKAKNGKYLRLKADEALMAKQHQAQLKEKMDSDARAFLLQRQAAEQQLMKKMQEAAKAK